MLQAMTGRYFAERTRMGLRSEDACSTLRRAAATAIAPWPASAHAQTWRTACLGAALLDVLALVDGGEGRPRPSAAASGPLITPPS